MVLLRPAPTQADTPCSRKTLAEPATMPYIPVNDLCSVLA
jgi:hypothetical protein